MNEVKVIEIKKSVCAENEKDADDLRNELRSRGVFLLNLMSAPGSGKTTTLIQTINRIKDKLNVAVMEADIDSDVDAIKIKELDNSFRSILSKEEKEAVDYYGYSEHRTKPDNFEKNISSAYEKWLMIFFSDNDILFKPIDPARVGKIMEYIIFQEKIRKVELAKRLEIDRNTLNRYIKGIKLPTLDVIYRFSVIFNVSIDWILKNATK